MKTHATGKAVRKGHRARADTRRPGAQPPVQRPSPRGSGATAPSRRKDGNADTLRRKEFHDRPQKAPQYQALEKSRGAPAAKPSPDPHGARGASRGGSARGLRPRREDARGQGASRCPRRAPRRRRRQRRGPRPATGTGDAAANTAAECDEGRESGADARTNAATAAAAEGRDPRAPRATPACDRPTTSASQPEASGAEQRPWQSAGQ